MPTYKTSQEWLEQSSLLLQARPASTRITTKYSIKPVKPRKSKKDDGEDSTMSDAATAKPPRGSLEIKTFDPISGVALKYRTTKAAEVSRLITTLGSLGRTMSTSKAPEEVKDEPTADTPAEEKGAGALELKGGPQEKTQQAGVGGGKKKKKGKK
ncbi:hypothetical protein CkaCkLH20_07015 [Colletotrichum karsti]|uniref:SRP9 domain-containing protein n=1 Tax=Colletotrichum karsti TaxID=1095194 RepID=A0A9P6I413_9PEZI|nr:uncharacterized protein CkaCkLH20_07015 [Colletotrichum karsti]KAF9875634.1 hypothetical protein CkaCkLH20_07015 [Colletotrichum karsti]